MWKEFRELAVRGNVVDLAIGIMIGGAFAPIAKSMVDDIIMPPVGLLFGGAQASEPSTKKCPYCLTTLPIKATRCCGCTSQLEEGTAAA